MLAIVVADRRLCDFAKVFRLFVSEGVGDDSDGSPMYNVLQFRLRALLVCHAVLKQCSAAHIPGEGASALRFSAEIG